ncbi:Ig-like domain-containing protein [Enterobacter ludwigii]
MTPENPLAEGQHEAVVVITDPAGNASEPSDPIDFVVDLTPPEKPTEDCCNHRIYAPAYYVI